MNGEDQEKLRQELMELHYGLLDSAQADALHSRIESDVSVAEQWQQIQQLVGKIRDVARIENTPLPSWEMKPETSAPAPEEVAPEEVLGDRVVSTARPPQVVVQQRPSRQPAARYRPVFWASVWSALAALLGFGMVGIGYLQSLPEPPVAAMTLKATPLRDALKQDARGYRFTTSMVSESILSGSVPVVPANLTFSILASDRVLFSGSTRSDQRGIADILFPEKLVIPPDATLRVTAVPNDETIKSSSISFLIPRTRCITYLTTDRPVYRPGESVYFRSVTLNRQSLAPASGFPIEYELVGDQKSASNSDRLRGVTQAGVGQGVFHLPVDADPGDYWLRVRSLDGMFPEESVRLQLRAYLVPQLAKQLVFSRESFHHGDLVKASVKIENLVANQSIESDELLAGFLINGVLQEPVPFPVAKDGTAEIELLLPQTDPAASVQLQVEILQSGMSESQLFDVPIQSGGLEIEFYPEGGDLAEGMRNRVYFSVKDQLGQPASLFGVVLNQSRDVITEVRTTRDGLGRFVLEPELGDEYQLQVESENGSVQSFTLPKCRRDLPVLDTGGGVFETGSDIEFQVSVSAKRDLMARISCRGNLVDQRILNLDEGLNSFSIPLGKEVGGVVRLTLLDVRSEIPRPIAERLVYRRPMNRLDIQLLGVDDSISSYMTGQHVRLEFRISDEQKQPLPAILGISVVDEAALSLQRQKRPALETQFLLLSEIQHPSDLENADFYIDGDVASEQALDLLLGTQGWRRFATWDEAPSTNEFRAALVRLLELDGAEVSTEINADNSRVFVSHWIRYRQKLEVSTNKARIGLQYVATIMSLVWLVIFSWQRRKRSLAAVAGLLAVIPCFLVLGCGANPNASTQSDVSAESSLEADNVLADRDLGASEIAVPDALMSADKAEGGMQVQRMQPTQIPAPMMGQARKSRHPITMDDSKWVDWLTEEKVAWLVQRVAIMQSNKEVTNSIQITEQQRMELLSLRGMTAEAAAEKLVRELQFPIRQYAHQRQVTSEVRGRDFQETIYWHPALQTDGNGLTVIEFDLPDRVSTYRVHVDGHTFKGRIGSHKSTFVTHRKTAE